MFVFLYIPHLDNTFLKVTSLQFKDFSVSVGQEWPQSFPMRTFDSNQLWLSVFST